MNGYVLDTNHLSAAIRRNSPILHRLQEAHRQGFRLGTCWPVLCELECGIVQTAAPERYRRVLGAVMTEVRIWPFGWELVTLYGQLAYDLQRRGRVLSYTDIVLAALAQQLNVVLLTTDRDFEALPGLSTQNWLPGQ